MDAPGQTLSATRFAELAGVSRERLRTWERRYGFPAPRRVGAGPRRYALDDLAGVVAVRRAAAEGMPLADAIARVRRPDAAGGAGPETLAALVEHLPVTVAALSGPEPIRIEYVNAALRALPGAPRPGQELVRAAPAFAGSPCERALRRLFLTDAAPAAIHHPAWGGHTGPATRSALFRLPLGPGARTMVAMVGLEGDGERAARGALAAQRRELDELREGRARDARRLETVALLAEVLRRETEPEAAMAESLDVVARQTGARDAALARHASGRLVVGRSRRGVLTAGEAIVAAHPQLARALRDGEPEWLERASAAAVGVPDALRACAVPVALGGEPLGLLVLAFDEAEPLDAGGRRLLAAVAAALGFALLRDRLVAELRRAASANRPAE